MAARRRSDRRGHPRVPRSRTSTKSLLRFITCGSVDDGKSTLIGRLLYESKMLFEDQLAALEADSQQVGHAGRRARLRAAARRPGGRARAGHHDRRRLPLLLDRPAQVHRRRHAGPRAVHAQHGHRRVDRRLRRDPDRRAQGRAHPDAPPQLPRLAARHPPRRARGQQDGPRRLLARSASTRSRPTTARSPAEIGLRGRHLHPALGADGRQRRRAERRDALVRRARRCCEYLEAVEVDDERMQRAPFRLPVQWVNRPDLDFRGFAGTIAGGTVAARRPRRRPAVRARRSDGRADRDLRRRPRAAPSPASRSRSRSTDEIDVSRGDVIAPADAPAGRRRPVRGDHRLDGATSRCCPGRNYLHAASAAPTRDRDDRAAQVQAQRQHARARSRRRSSSSTRSASATSSSTGRSPSTPTPRTARPAASS